MANLTFRFPGGGLLTMKTKVVPREGDNISIAGKSYRAIAMWCQYEENDRTGDRYLVHLAPADLAAPPVKP